MKLILDKWRLLALGGVVLGLAVAGLVYRDFRGFLSHRVAKTTELSIAKGWGIQKIAGELAERQVVASPLWFVFLDQFHGTGSIKAGYYRFEPGEDAATVLKRLRSGDVAKGRLVIAEGLTVREVVDHMRKAGLQEAVTALADPALPQRLGANVRSLEGYLFPDTYIYRVKDPKDDLVTRIITQGRKVFEQEWLTRPTGYALTAYEALIIASMIEKETGQVAERSHVSGVFHNRLKRKIKLQSDPTVVYGIPEFSGPITRAHLLAPTPYNTYVNQGLPPTPICNPGRASIHAALHPDETEDLYFVARGDGTHLFARTLPEHNKNVARMHRPGGG
ncbi:MAG: endolytic transglycosylase MltG [Magnetococcales bacterium]|nr:endolytic transglycosylase MltG [Magnetococcales bacterium]